MFGPPPTGLKQRATVPTYRALTERTLPRSGFVLRPNSDLHRVCFPSFRLTMGAEHGRCASVRFEAWILADSHHQSAKPVELLSHFRQSH